MRQNEPWNFATTHVKKHLSRRWNRYYGSKETKGRYWSWLWVSTVIFAQTYIIRLLSSDLFLKNDSRLAYISAATRVGCAIRHAKTGRNKFVPLSDERLLERMDNWQKMIGESSADT